MKKSLNKKKLTSWLAGGLSALGVLALTCGLVFGLGNFSSKSQIDQPEQSTQGATQPNDTSKYWGEEGYDYANHRWSGSGTEADPWLIQTEQDLACLSWRIYNDQVTDSSHKSDRYFYQGFYFKQTKDLNVSAYYWTPIGVGYNRNNKELRRYFSGDYDGDGHTVAGVFTPSGSESKNSNQGLFGYVYGKSRTENASISNVGVVDSFIQGKSSIGGIVGCIESSIYYYCIISNCYNTGSVRGRGIAVGGVVGENSNSVVSNCYNTGSVDSGAMSNYIGGVVGRNEASTYNSFTIRNCYNIGSISSTGSTVGGIVGYNTGQTIVSNCYNTGSVSGTSSMLGGIVGQNVGSAKCNNSYYGGECTLTKGIGAGSYSETTKIADLNTTNYAKNKDWYTNSSNWNSTYPWDFKRVWGIHQDYNDGYPTFKNLLPPPTNWIEIADTSWAGEGTEASPYLIDTPEKLAGIAAMCKSGEAGFEGKYFKQVGNINLSGLEWFPIGYEMGEQFLGNYDGGNYQISGMLIEEDDRFSGLFGINKGIVENVNLINSKITFTGVYAGGIAAAVEGSGVIKNCTSNCTIEYISTTIEFKGLRQGGIAGYAYPGTRIENCTNYGSMISNDSNANDIGGVIGWTEGATITGCVNYGTILVAGSFSGGVAGSLNSGAKVINCINYGNVFSEGFVIGGISGYVNASSITNSINKATIKAANRAGGIAGRCEGDYGKDYKANCVIENCATYGFIDVVNGIHPVSGLVGEWIHPQGYKLIITNCSAVVDSNFSDFQPFFGGSEADSVVVSSCYSVVNNVKRYSDGDFAGFGLVAGMNNGLPMQRELFFMAEFAPDLDVNWFKNNGFNKIA